MKQIVGSNLSRTNSCGCAILARGRQSPHWKGHEEISSRHWSHIRSQAIERGYEFSISIEKGWDMFCNQNRKCAFTGRLIGFNSGTTAKYTRRTASLDRKDSSKGYVIDNVHWVHKDVNRMKGTLPLEEFVQICKEIARYTETGEQL